jgi:arsenate reductase
MDTEASKGRLDMQSVLFVCTHNSARSQMAEGLLRHMYGDSYEASSGGTSPTKVQPHAVQAMKEIGIDISGQRAEDIRSFDGRRFDYVVTLCDRARGTCPFFAGAREYIHQGFEDPAAYAGSDEESLAAFRRVRDQIREWIEARFGGRE